MIRGGFGFKQCSSSLYYGNTIGIKYSINIVVILYVNTVSNLILALCSHYEP